MTKNKVCKSTSTFLFLNLEWIAHFDILDSGRNVTHLPHPTIHLSHPIHSIRIHPKARQNDPSLLQVLLHPQCSQGKDYRLHPKNNGK